MKKKIRKKLIGALAVCMFAAAAWIVLASELTIATQDSSGDIENGSDTTANNIGECLYNRAKQRWQYRMGQFGSSMQGMQYRMGQFGSSMQGMQYRMGQFGSSMQGRIWQNVWSDYLSITRLEGILEYDNGLYMVDSTVLYLGNEWFLESLARSDYDGDGTYEYVWQELEGLIGTTIVINGILEDNIVYASHINGIWLRAPNQADITEIEGVLEYSNGSYFVDGTELVVKQRGFSKSDIDGDGRLERMLTELGGLVGEEITVDGTVTDDGRMFVAHINGIWIS